MNLRFWGAIFFLLLPLSTHAASLGFAPASGLWFSQDNVFAGIAVKAYTVVVNNSYPSLSATIAFLDNGQEFARTNVEVPLEEARQVGVIWTPTLGNSTVAAKIVSARATLSDGSTRVLSLSEIEAAATPVSRTITVDGDSDRDGIGDHDEMATYHTSPTMKDSDGDGLSDYDEIYKYKTNPNASNTDGDGMNDGDEVRAGRNPLIKDDPLPPPPTPAPTPEPAPEPVYKKPAVQPPAIEQKISQKQVAKQVSGTTTAAPDSPVSSADPDPSPTSTTTGAPLPSPLNPAAAPEIASEDDPAAAWVKVLAIIAGLCAAGAAATGFLAWKERRRY